MSAESLREPTVVTVAAGADADRVRAALVEAGLWLAPLGAGGGRVSFLIERHSARVDAAGLLAIPGVESVACRPDPTPRVSAQAGRPVVVAGVPIGAGAPPVLMAGPCAVESEASLHALAAAVRAAGGRFLRGGAFKPRSSPYAFQGHGACALAWLRRAADAHGLGVVTEAVGEAEVPAVAEQCDLLQIGSRNMQSFKLLERAAATRRPVLLKRGFAATIEEWLLAGEYLLVHGAPSVIFCERGVRSFDPHTRNLLDLGAVALLAAAGHPVLVDPSHAAGRRDLVPALARAAIAAGAAGLLVEVHDRPGHARSDGPQALAPAELSNLGVSHG